MARKPVEIELEKCPMLESTLVMIANRIDLVGKIIEGRGNKLIGLKTNIKKLISDSLNSYENDTIQLFGKLKYSNEDIESINYLKSLI